MELYGYEFIRESDLAHHGIKGQKWGQRRFQNEDGTWTAAGRERYGGSDGPQRSFKGNFHRALAANYGLNAKVYSKNNKALASMNRQAQSEQLKKAAEADAAKAQKMNDPEHQKRVETMKKVAKVGAVVAGTALVAYGAYKLNGKLNDNIRKEYLNKGMDWVRKSSELTRIANESAKNLKRDTDNFKSSPAWQDPANSKYAPAYLRGLELRAHHAQQQLNSAVAARSRATQYYEKAKQDNYSLAEKRDALKRMARRK